MSYQDQVELLVSQLAEARVGARFQDTYITIYGSQHARLRMLNSQTGTGTVTRDAAQAFLQHLATINPTVAKANHEFNAWLIFLVQRGFVNVTVDSVSITNGGQDFLVWTMRRQLADRSNEGP